MSALWTYCMMGARTSKKYGRDDREGDSIADGPATPLRVRGTAVVESERLWMEMSINSVDGQLTLNVIANHLAPPKYNITTVEGIYGWALSFPLSA